MEVLVEFDPAYQGPAADAVWIVNTPHNRSWFERQGCVDSNSATFNEDASPLGIIWNVFEHHPNWTQIVVRGAALTSELQQQIEADAVVESQGPEVFRLRRR